jgi:hypothetical protein
MIAIVAKLREFAPYAALELVMPGGSLMALGLLLYRRQKEASLPSSAGEALSATSPLQTIRETSGRRKHSDHGHLTAW